MADSAGAAADRAGQGFAGPVASRWSRIDWLLWTPLALCAALGLAFISTTAVVIDGKTYFSLADDVMISMTYARNFAEGHGLTWTPGEPPVEGYTNPLWTFWMALLHLVSPVDRYAPLLVALSSLCCLLIGVAGVYALANRLGLSGPGTLVSMFAAATLYAPAFWAIRGFEVGPLIAIHTWMLVFALSPGAKIGRVPVGVVLGLLGVVAVWTRMDALALSGLICAVRLVRRDRQGVIDFAAACAFLAAALIVLFLARHAYYGDWLPNTAYLKLSNNSLLARLRAGLSSDYHNALRWLPLGLLALLPIWFLAKGPLERLLAYLAVLATVAIQFAYVAYSGGDAWEWSQLANRFQSTAAMSLCVCAGLGAALLIDRLKLATRAAYAAAVGLIVLIFGWTSFKGWSDTFSSKRAFEVPESGRLIRDGLALKSGTDPGFSYAVTWAGMIPYHAPGRRPVDLLGKMDKVIARMTPREPFKPGHNKFDLDYSLGQLRPDAIVHIPANTDDPATRRMLEGWGYEQTPGNWWLRQSARHKVRPELLHYPLTR